MAGQWDETNMEVPSFVIGHDGVHRIYYAGSPGNGTIGTDAWQIGFLEFNGSVWARHGDPVLTGVETWELWTGVSFVSEPTVAYDANTHLYHMWYTAGSGVEIGYANSFDGVTWGNKAEFFPYPDTAWTPKVIKVDSHYEMFIASINNAASAAGTLKTEHGIYRMRSKVLTGDFEAWGGLGGLQQVHRTQDGSTRHTHWIHNPTVGRNRAGDLVIFCTGRNTVASTLPQIVRFTIPPMGD